MKVQQLKDILEKIPSDWDVCLGTQGVTIPVDDIIPMAEVNTLKIECSPKDFVEYSKYVMLEEDYNDNI